MSIIMTACGRGGGSCIKTHIVRRYTQLPRDTWNKPGARVILALRLLVLFFLQGERFNSYLIMNCL